MPTQHIDPESHGELLQDVANSILKSRKVVVVTGAGISTNSGIPDFRSENGLYSLIQAHYDAARQCKDDESESEAGSDDERPSKRQRLAAAESDSESDEDEDEDAEESEASCITLASANNLDDAANLPSHNPQGFSTPKTRQHWQLHGQQLPTSPLSSPPTEIEPPTLYRKHSWVLEQQFARSSSPLSSPPPFNSDPFDSNLHSESTRRSTSPSEDDSPPPKPSIPVSQRGSTLPKMQGKDLFDAQIWSDPVRTSVFYTFTTTLRRKIREAKPTSSHKFISHLRDKGKLVRCYTQNIDMIEEKVGLSTSLDIGAGARGRFSRKSTGNSSQLSKMVEESTESSEQSTPEPTQQPSQSTSEHGIDQSEAKSSSSRTKAELLRCGVECVFLHGSLEQLRCFHCGKLCSWDDPDREAETLSGEQPECPHCMTAAADREERGKRALGVGKLRPDIVLYGEEHPSATLISPIVTHDLSLCPDMLLILGTSLRVHGLKTMVREFAKAVHTRGGKVVFVNFTKPSESVWGDVIDYWIEWDCDAWVGDLQERVPGLWNEQIQGPCKLKRISSGMTEEEKELVRKERELLKEQEKEAKDKEKARVKAERNAEREKMKKEKDDEKERVRRRREDERAQARRRREVQRQLKEKQKPAPANPVALRNDRTSGAYWSLKVVDEARRIAGSPPIARGQFPSLRPESRRSSNSAITFESPSDDSLLTPPRTRRGPRKSAPSALSRPMQVSSTLNPNHGRPLAPHQELEQYSSPLFTSWQTPASKESNTPPSSADSLSSEPSDASPDTLLQNSILRSVKGRSRKRTQRAQTMDEEKHRRDLRLPPLRPENRSRHDRKLQPLEPDDPPSGPLRSISPNLRIAKKMDRSNSFYMDDPLVRTVLSPYIKQMQVEGERMSSRAGEERLAHILKAMHRAVGDKQ